MVGFWGRALRSPGQCEGAGLNQSSLEVRQEVHLFEARMRSWFKNQSGAVEMVQWEKALAAKLKT